MTDQAAAEKPSRFGEFSRVPRRVRWFIYLLSFSAIGYGYLTVIISAYLPERGMSPGSVGLILGAGGASLVVSAIPLGMLSDRIGRKWIFIAGTIMLIPALLAFAVTEEVSLLVLAGILGGVAEGGFLSTWNALIADQTKGDERNAAFSLSFIVSNAAMGTGFALPILFPPLQSALSVDSHALHVAFIFITALLSIVTPIGSYYLLKDYKEIIKEKKSKGEKWDMKPLLKFSGINSLIGLGAGFIIPLIPTWLFLKFGVPDTLSGPLLALSSLTIGLSAVASPLLARRFGNIKAMVLTQALSTIFMLSLAFVMDPITAGAFYLVRAALMNMSSPLGDSFLMGIVPPEQRGLASAVNSLIWRLPNSASTVVGGMLLSSGEYSLPFFIATSFYIAAIALFYLVFKDVKQTE